MNKVEVWYDNTHFQTWCVTVFDEFGDQVGETDFYHLKADAVKWAKRDYADAKLVVYTKDGKCQN
jgi:hypothetical protein